MADNDPTRAGHACAYCRTRKRACDKLLPKCSYCDRRGLPCGYKYGHKVEPFSQLPLRAWSIKTGEGSFAVPTKNLVLSCLESSKTTPERVCEEFFKSFHAHMNVISPDFYSKRYKLESSQQAELSIILLAMHLLIDHVDADAYLNLKSLLATAQASQEPSLALVQAYLLVAALEYTMAWTRSAAATLATCSIIARILKYDVPPDDGYHLEQQSMEAWNTWCGITMLETVVLAELNLTSALSSRLSAESPIPFSLDNPSRSRAPLESVEQMPLDTCLFSHQVKAAWLLSLVTDLISTRLTWDGYVRMDEQVKSFLQEMLDQEIHEPLLGRRAPALATTIRSLYVLHKHVLNHPEVLQNAQPIPEQISRATLTMATRVMLDIASSDNHQEQLATFHTLPLCCRENVQSAREWAVETQLDGIAMWRLIELDRHLAERLNVSSISETLGDGSTSMD